MLNSRSAVQWKNRIGNVVGILLLERYVVLLLIRVFQLATYSKEKRFFASLRMTIYVTLNGVKGLSRL